MQFSCVYYILNRQTGIETENRLVAARDKDGEGSQKRKCLIVGAGFLFGMLKSLNIILR